METLMEERDKRIDELQIKLRDLAYQNDYLKSAITHQSN